MRRAVFSILLPFFLLSPTSYVGPPTSNLLPPPSNVQLPDFDQLYARVRENLAKSERIAYLYAFKERRTDVHTNPFGRIGTGGTRLYEVYPSPNPELTYRRLVARNGAPVSASELAEQDGEYTARVAAARRKTPARPEEERARRAEDATRARRRGQTMVDDVVDTLQFKLEGRGSHAGVPAIVVSFSPRPGARPRTREGRMAQKFIGTVWVHEAAFEVMRVEAKSIDDISFGYGVVARLSEGTIATMTRAAVDGGVWMPIEIRLRGSGRAAVVRRLVMDFVMEWFDYRRLRGDSAAPFLDSRIEGQSGGSPQ